MALRSDPSSDEAHCNRGWLALYANEPAEALPHFREALRLDPTSESARQGLVQSLHARSPLYRWMLRYYLWTSRLTQTEFWGAMMLVSAINSALRAAARVFPPLLILLIPYFIFYMAFTFFSWISDSLFNLLLRLSPTGKLILSKDEAASAAGCGFTGMLFLINVCAFIAALFLRPGEFAFLWVFLVGAFLSAAMMIPVAGIFKIDPSRRKRRGTLVVLAALLGANAVCGWSGAFYQTPWQAVFLVLFVLGWLLYPWIANFVLLLED